MRTATAADVDTILRSIQSLAEFEKLSHEVVATREKLLATLFSAERPAAAHVILAELRESESHQLKRKSAHLSLREPAAIDMTWQAAGFALYFFNYSTFLAQPGLYLEDLFVEPTARSHGIGRILLHELAKIAVANGCGRMEWSVLDWNERALSFYRSLGAKPLDQWTVQRLTGSALIDLASKRPETTFRSETLA